MPRQKETRSRVLGPYRKRNGWRLLVRSGGREDYSTYATKEEAEQVKASLEKKYINVIPGKTIQEAMDSYAAYLTHEKGNKTRSVKGTIARMGYFFSNREINLHELTPRTCAQMYQTLTQAIRPKTGKPLAVDSHRNFLAEAKTFLEWCVTQRWMRQNPLKEVKGHGRRRHGKLQLRIDEARKWIQKANEYAKKGEQGAIAAMMTLLLGMRCEEIITRVVRDLDDQGRLLWIPESKTAAGKRTLEVPEVLKPYLCKLIQGKRPEELLFGKHWRDWPRLWVKRICKEAGVPIVCAHSMRGLHGTLALAAGATGALVAASLGHESVNTTLQSYIRPEVKHNVTAKNAWFVLQGDYEERRHTHALQN